MVRMHLRRFVLGGGPCIPIVLPLLPVSAHVPKMLYFSADAAFFVAVPAICELVIVLATALAWFWGCLWGTAIRGVGSLSLGPALPRSL